MAEKTVLAIDPGTGKCGLALVNRDASGALELLHRAIVTLEGLVPMMHRTYAVKPFSEVILGGGTGSKAVAHLIRDAFPSMAILTVDERETTLQARERYWEKHPRKGWRRLLPSSLQMPPEPFDDFAALVISERVLLDP